MIIHFHFPRLENGNGVAPLSDKPISDFRASAQAILKVFSIMDQPADSGRVCMGIRPSSNPDISALGLDACGRAMNRICDGCVTGSEAQKQCVAERAGDLLELATALHTFAKHSKLLPSTRATRVRKQLKYVMRNLEGTHLNFSLFGNTTLLKNAGSEMINTSPLYPMYNPFLPTLPNEPYGEFAGSRMLNFFGATDSNASISQISLGREDGSHVSNACLDEMQFGALSAGGAPFDLSFASVPMDRSSTSAGGVHELKASIDSACSTFPG